MAPKTLPSIFTYQDDDGDVDVEIQFLEQNDDSGNETSENNDEIKMVKLPGSNIKTQKKLPQGAVIKDSQDNKQILSHFNGGEY